jgi:hypothetical protein
VDLKFTNEELARLCSRRDELTAWVGPDAAALEQLLNEIDCADTLGRLEALPHVLLQRAPRGRVGAHGDDDAGVLLKPEADPDSYREAESAIVVAVAVGLENFNPEGATWPRAFATSQTMQ